jgi:hypothetical protein
MGTLKMTAIRNDPSGFLQAGKGWLFAEMATIAVECLHPRVKIKPE